MLILSRDQSREVDRIAIEHYGIPGIVLMENAGRSATREILKFAESIPFDPSAKEADDASGQLRVAIVCGGGNNGGDGYVIARHLHIAGESVAVYSAVEPEKLTGDAAINAGIVEKMEIPKLSVANAMQLENAEREWARADIVVDALLGTGFSGQVRPELAAIIERINALKGPRVVAIDVPSGMDCQSGETGGACVRAHLTVTFVAMKTGFLTKRAKEYLGKVVVAGIGIPPALLMKLTKLSSGGAAARE